MYISKVALAVGGASLVAAAPVVEKRAEITDGNTCPFLATLVVQWLMHYTQLISSTML